MQQDDFFSETFGFELEVTVLCCVLFEMAYLSISDKKNIVM